MSKYLVYKLGWVAKLAKLGQVNVFLYICIFMYFYAKHVYFFHNMSVQILQNLSESIDYFHET